MISEKYFLGLLNQMPPFTSNQIGKINKLCSTINCFQARFFHSFFSNQLKVIFFNPFLNVRFEINLKLSRNCTFNGFPCFKAKLPLPIHPFIVRNRKNEIFQQSLLFLHCVVWMNRGIKLNGVSQMNPNMNKAFVTGFSALRCLSNSKVVGRCHAISSWRETCQTKWRFNFKTIS